MNLIYDNLKDMQELFNEKGSCGSFIGDILFEAINLLKQHKNIEVVPEQIEQISFIDPAADPLKPARQFIKIHSIVYLQPVHNIIMETTFRVSLDVFTPGLIKTDDEEFKLLQEKNISGKQLAAIRVVKELCKTIKKEREYRSMDFEGRIANSRVVWDGTGNCYRFEC